MLGVRYTLRTMQYYFDFDRTVFDTESFKRAFRKHPPFRDLGLQLRQAFADAFGEKRTLPLRRVLTRTFGTYASHRRFGFMPQELKEYLYPDAVAFFEKNGKDCTIVTYGVRAFITAKVANALSDFPLKDVIYTPYKKGPLIRRLCGLSKEQCVFVDDAHFQLESVSRYCPDATIVEIRRDGQDGDGRWPVIRTFEELPYLIPEEGILPA